MGLGRRPGCICGTRGSARVWRCTCWGCCRTRITRQPLPRDGSWGPQPVVVTNHDPQQDGNPDLVVAAPAPALRRSHPPCPRPLLRRCTDSFSLGLSGHDGGRRGGTSLPLLHGEGASPASLGAPRPESSFAAQDVSDNRCGRPGRR